MNSNIKRVYMVVSLKELRQWTAAAEAASIELYGSAEHPKRYQHCAVLEAEYDPKPRLKDHTGARQVAFLKLRTA